MSRQMLGLIIVFILLALCGAALFWFLNYRLRDQREPQAILPGDQQTQAAVNAETDTAAAETQAVAADPAARKAEIQPLIDAFVRERQDRLLKESAGRPFNDDELKFLSNNQTYALEALIKQGKLQESDKQLFK